ncbi:MAG: phosphoglucosamine mutase [Candidatus Kapaibacteriales bacterium]
MPLIRSISGIRATIGDSLLPAQLSDYVAAYAHFLPEGPITVGRDGRPTGLWIEKIVSGTLIAMGRQVRILGVVPTPTVQLLTEKSDAVGGISITASHNPEQWNGLKFLNSEGVFLDAAANEKIFDTVDQAKIQYPDTFEHKIHEVILSDSIKSHIDAVLSLSILTDQMIEDIAKSNLLYTVDAVNASGSKIVPDLLATLGIECEPLFCDGSGEFPHTPEPLEANLTELMERMAENKANMGIAVDPDADRLVLIDENGKAIGEEKTVALSAKAVLESMKGRGIETKGAILTVNLSTSRMIDDVAAEYGAKVERSPVGEINVVSKMKENGSVFGGEGSGGVILPECHYGRDSLVGIVLISSLLTNRARLSGLSDSLPKYEIIKEKVEFSGDLKPILEKISKDENYKKGKIDKSDGIRIDFEDSWVQLRASNTEPIVRMIAEAPTRKAAQKLIKEIKAFL